MSLLQAFSPYLELIRYRGRALSFGWSALVGALIGSGGVPPLIPTLAGALAMYLVGLSAYVYNDIQDLETDRMNESNRPIPSGRVSVGQAQLLVIVAAMVALLLALCINVGVLSLVLFGLVLGVVYSTPPVSLKKRFLCKQLTVSLWCAVSSLGGGAAVGAFTGTVIYAALLFFVYSMAMSPVVDIGDVIGDRRTGRRTLPIVKGPVFTVGVAAVIMLCLGVATAFTYSWLGFNILCPILVGTLSVLAVASIKPLIHRWKDTGCCKRTVKKLMLLHFLLQASLVIGAH